MDDHQDEEGVSPPLPAMLQNNKVKEIMGKVVSAQSAKNYSYQNIAFALYCYESDELRSLLLEPWFVEKLHQFSKVSICPLFFYVGVELDGKVRECCPCKLFPRHLG